MKTTIIFKAFSKILLALFLMTLLKSSVLAQKKWTIDEIMNRKRLSSPELSPDGRYILYRISYWDLDKERTFSEYYTITSDGSKTQQLKQALRSQQWMPDSKLISYLSPGNENGKRVTQVMGVQPDGKGEKLLTTVENNFISYTWSPKATHFFYVSDGPANENKISYEKEWGVVISPEEPKWAEYKSLWLASIKTGSSTKVYTGNFLTGSVQWSPDGKSIAFLSHGSNNRPPELYIAAIDGIEKPKAVTNSGIGVRYFSWSPDGKSIAYSVAEEDPPVYANFFYDDPRNLYYDDPHLGPAEIWNYDVSSGSSRRVSNEEFPELTEFFWSNDSKKLVFLLGADDSEPSITHMYILSIVDGNVKHIARGTDFYRGGRSITWLKDDSEIWFLNGERMGYNIFSVDVSSGEVHHVTEGQDYIKSVNYSNDFSLVSFTKENANTKPDIYVSKTTDWNLRKITDVIPEIHDFANPKTEIIQYRSDGWTIDALLIKPPDFDPGKKYPLLLITHGGPAWYKLNEWCPEWEEQPLHAYAAEGYCMVFPNVRGSANYGLEFRNANFHDFGGCDVRDALRAVDYLLDQGFIDEDKMGTCGWSYGGYMTPAIITRTDRFKAAQFGAGLPSFEAMYSLMSTVEFVIDRNFGSYPWDDAQMQIQYSPLYSAMKVKTPTLIQHGDKDPRCPVAGSILFYKALKSYNVPVVLEIYPEQGHHVIDPLLHKRCLTKNLEWFNKWIKGDTNTSFERLFPSGNVK
ncbi:prolyl oligopeptidase family serine peptidase [Bacteroidota bacterium]